MPRLRSQMRSRFRRAIAARYSLGTGIADRCVVLALLQALEKGPVAAGEPADAQAGKAVGLGGDVEREGRLGQVRRLRQGALPVDLDAAVHLVAEEADAALVAQLDQRAKRRFVRHVAGGVVGVVDGDQRRVRSQKAAQLVEVERPAVFTAHEQRAHVGAGRERHRLHRLVAGNGDHGVIAWAGEFLHRPEHRLLRPCERQHVAGIDGVVGAGHRLAQILGPPGLDVGERHRHEALPVRRAPHLQQFVERDALRVRGGQVVAGAELPLSEVLLETERAQRFHVRASLSKA